MFVQILCCAKVQQLNAAVPLDHDIIRADVPVDDPLPVDLAKVLHHRAEQGIARRVGHGTFPPQTCLQGLALHIVHDDIGSLVCQKRLPHTHHGRDILHPCHLARFFQEIILCILTAAVEFIAAAPVKLTFTFPAHGGTGRIIFLDRHPALQREVKANIRDAKTAAPQHVAHKILAVQDRIAGHCLRRLGGFLCIKAAKRACTAPESRQFPHTVRAAIDLHDRFLTFPKLSIFHAPDFLIYIRRFLPQLY